MKKEKNPIFNVFATEWAFLRDKRKTFVLYLTLFTIAGVISLMTPLVIGMIFNAVQNQITSQAQLYDLIKMISLLLAITVGFWVFHGTARVLEQKTGFLVHRNYISDKIEKVLDLPVKWHKDHHSGDTIDKINRGSLALAEFSRNTTFEIFYAVINIVGSIIILFFFDVRAALLAMAFSFFVIYTIYRFDQKMNEQYKELNLYGNRMSAAVFDYISNIITVITLRLKGTVKKEIDHRIMASFPLEKKNVLLNEFKWGFAGIAISLMTVLVLSWRAYSDYTTNGVIMIGTLYILYGYLDSVGRTFNRFASLYRRLVRHNSRIVNAYPIDEAFEEVREEHAEALPSNWKEIILEDVSFTHNKKAEVLHLENVAIRLKRGQKIALIGASGSGKSTMLALLRGLGNPDSGKVLVDKNQLADGFSRIKKHVTLIPQDPELFNNTIRYNVTMDLPAQEKEIAWALELAQFDSVVKRLKKGLETNVLEKGVSLSGGEKQRLALARGLLAAKNSDILLMDEPTSSVDTANELKIYDSILKEFKGKTIVSSIHRLHLLRKFDYIYVFDKGRVIAEGTLNELKKKPFFAVMWAKYHRGK